MNSTDTMYGHLNPEENHFLQEVQNEIPTTRAGDTVPLVALVMHTLRETLSVRTAEVLLQKLPGLFKTIFVYNWRPSENRVVVEHLDELVALVMERDKTNGKLLFKSEIEALSVVILTLKKICSYVDPRSVQAMSPSLYKELREAF